MRELRDVLKGSFDAHAGALGAGSSWDGLAERSVRDARTRRAWRAGAAGTVAAAAAVGIVATAVAVGGHDAGGGDGGGGDALNPAQRAVMDDPNSLGECAAFVPANGALLPDGLYSGRAYVDPAADFVVAVMPDGTATRVQPGPDGDYPFHFGDGPRSLMIPTGYPVIVDYMSNGAGGGSIWADAGTSSWDWTMEPLAPAPSGVNVKSLASTFTMTLGFEGGQRYEPNAVPDGAVTEVVEIYSDGHEVAGALVRDASAPSYGEDLDFDGLEAVAMRVTLADGQVWEMRADYTPESNPVLPCEPTPPSGWQPPATPVNDDADEPGTSSSPAPSEGATAPDARAMGDPLTGPESEVFQCEAPLPADLEDTADVTARLATGEVMLNDPDVFDVGEDGMVVDVNSPIWERKIGPDTVSSRTPRATGWHLMAGSEGGGLSYGNETYLETVAVKDGMIIGFAHEPVDDRTAGGIEVATVVLKSADTVNLTGGFVSAINGIHGLLEPCGDVAPGDLADAQLAVLYGFGPDVADVEYGWTLVAPE